LLDIVDAHISDMAKPIAMLNKQSLSDK
jgi:hypothetical protein